MTAAIFIAKYWREIAISLAVVLLIVAVMYIKSVFTERNKLQLENAVLVARLKDAAAMQEMQNNIADAISKIRIRSNINVSRIETKPKPVFVNSDPLVLIPGGVLQAVYSSSAANRTAPGDAYGSHIPTAGSTSRILPR